MRNLSNKLKYFYKSNVGIVVKSNRKIADRSKIDTLRQNNITAHFPGLVQTLQ